MNQVVIGLGYGDEGKGSVTHHLATDDSLVVRFNGGHQAGHTVAYKRSRHVFSNFTSGTVKKAIGYWSRFCTVHPVGLMNEYRILQKKKITPWLHYIDPLCPVTTPWDIERNQDNTRKFGFPNSVGVGFGTTIQRQEDHYMLHARDLLFPQILEYKLSNILSYYRAPYDLQYYEFLKAVKQMQEVDCILIKRPEVPKNMHVVFEGAQGIMLDQDHGFFPFVTRSYTTCRNALEVMVDLDIADVPYETYYVTRPYQTRHGVGPMVGKLLKTNAIDDPLETNVTNKWQGDFFKAPLDLETMKYAVQTDALYNKSKYRILAITCRDQVKQIELLVSAKPVNTKYVKAIKVVTELDLIDALSLPKFKVFSLDGIVKSS